MTDLKAVKDLMADSGLKMYVIAERLGIKPGTLYNRLNGKGEFTVSEILSFQDTFNLTNKQRDDIFLD